MTAKKRSTPANWNDPDDAPELTAVFFKYADLYEGSQHKTHGRSKALTTKEPVKLRLDADCWLRCVPTVRAGRRASTTPSAPT